jgi:thiamine-monophosphate kinase
LIVTGPLGGSLRRGRHLTFTPRLAVAEWLVRNTRPSAMMDISDGLATDLPRLAHQCQLAVELDETRLPIHADVPADAAERHRIAAALTDGEDFELVFAIDQKVAGSLDSVPRDLGVSFTAIGSLQPGQGCFITDARGVRQPLSVGGYRHSF